MEEREGEEKEVGMDCGLEGVGMERVFGVSTIEFVIPSDLMY